MVQLCNDHYRMPARLFANFIGTLVHPPPLNGDAVMLSAVLKLVTVVCLLVWAVKYQEHQPYLFCTVLCNC